MEDIVDDELDLPARLPGKTFPAAVRRTVMTDEPTEYAGYVRANKFVAILKRQAQQMAILSSASG